MDAGALLLVTNSPDCAGWGCWCLVGRFVWQQCWLPHQHWADVSHTVLQYTETVSLAGVSMFITAVCCGAMQLVQDDSL